MFNVMNIRLVGAKLFHADRHTMTNLIVAFAIMQKHT